VSRNIGQHLLVHLDVRAGRADTSFAAQGRKRRRILPALLIGLVTLGSAIRVQAQTTTVLYSFALSNNFTGINPQASLIRDASGNFFGTTAVVGFGGECAFELVNSAGSYAAKSLYDVYQSNIGCSEAGLVMDGSGNLYGTTSLGGDNYEGAVFELVNSNGSYTEQLLYSFGGYPSDGVSPLAALVMDTKGNLYGTTSGGGSNGPGTVFELVNSAGSYTEKLLYSFAGPAAGGQGADGAHPLASLLADAAGNLYGTTNVGGAYGGGIAFELVNSSGVYTEHILYSFGASSGDGLNPVGGLITDGSGNLYGTTPSGGANSQGTVFELVNSSATYAERILYSFTGSGGDGANPQASLVMDAAGDLYGTTLNGGISSSDCSAGCGIVFELVNSSGSYRENVLHRFGNYFGDGERPQAALIMDPSGNLFGTTVAGGTAGNGTVFEVNPSATGSVVSLSASYLDFGAVPAGTETTEPVTATNSGNADLIFGSDAVTLSGVNAADFTLSADSCSGATLTPDSTCSLSVRFAPSQLGPESATLTLTDNATNNPQTVPLTATGAAVHDFTIGIAAGSSNSFEIVEGGTATYVLSVSPLGGFNQAITFACTGAPYDATCSVNPSSLKLNGTSASTITVTVTTVSSYGPSPNPTDDVAPPRAKLRDTGRWFVVLLTLTAILLILRNASRLSRKPALQLRLRLATLVALLLALATWTTCYHLTPVVATGTPPGTFTLTVTGTASSGSTNLSHSIALTLIVDYPIF